MKAQSVSSTHYAQCSVFAIKDDVKSPKRHTWGLCTCVQAGECVIDRRQISVLILVAHHLKTVLCCKHIQLCKPW